MKKILVIVFICLSLSATAAADGIVSYEEIENSLSDEVRSTVSTDIDNVAENSDSALKKIWLKFKDELFKQLHENESKAVNIFVIAVICSGLKVFCDEKSGEYTELCGCAAITVFCVGDINSYIETGSRALESISTFSTALLPAMCSAGAACGTIGSASAKYIASAMFMDIFVLAAQKFIIPLVYVYLALVIAASTFNNEFLTGISKVLKKICSAALTALTLAFTVYISISSSIASSTDAVAAKLTKTAISAALPIVGSVISDAASGVVAGAELIKSSVGVFGMLGVIGICAAPLAIIGVNYLLLKASALFVSAFNSDRISSLVDGIGAGFGMLIALIGCGGIMMFIAITSCMKAVTA